MPANKWEYIPAHDVWTKKVTFEATPGRRRNTFEVAVRRERKGSKIWRADLLSMMGWEALTPTHYERVEDAKREIDHILAAFSRVRHDPHNDDDIQAVAHYVVKHSGSDRDPAFSEASPGSKSPWAKPGGGIAYPRATQFTDHHPSHNEYMKLAKKVGHWTYYPAIPAHHQVPQAFWGNYSIRNRGETFDVVYRPEGHHVELGDFSTEAAAKHAAEEHAKLPLKKRLIGESVFGRIARSKRSASSSRDPSNSPDIPWRIKAKKIIEKLSAESYRQAQKTTGGKLKRHVPYSIPETAQRLVDALNRNDEEMAKSIMMYDYDATRVMGHRDPQKRSVRR